MVWGSILSWVCAAFHIRVLSLSVSFAFFHFLYNRQISCNKLPRDVKVNKCMNVSGLNLVMDRHSVWDKFFCLGRSVPGIGSGSTVTLIKPFLRWMNEEAASTVCVCEREYECACVGFEVALKPWSPHDMLGVLFHLRVTCDINFHNGLWWHQGGGTTMRADSTS